MEISLTLTEIESLSFNNAILEILNTDIFNYDCIGYWACGIACRPDANGDNHWLLFEDGEERSSDEEELVERFLQDEEPLGDLPPGYHHLRRREAKHIAERALLQYGIGFLDGTTDASDLDRMVQLVVLGNFRYC